MAKAVRKVGEKEVSIGGPVPQVKPGEKLVRRTASVCPVCYRLIPAIIVERDGKLYIRKVCPEHGETEELYRGAFLDMYNKFMKFYTTRSYLQNPIFDAGRPCPYNCGLCPLHMSHTGLLNIVVTNRCDLSCRYCFFYAERAGFVYEPTIDQIREMIRTAHKQGIRAKAIQLTGGEPTMRDDLVEIVRAVREENITHVQLNTHIIRLAYDYELTRKLREAGVNTVYMSFDGVTPNVNTKNHREVPYFFENARKAKMTSLVLVPTVIRGRNTDQLGAIIEFAARNMDVVRSVNFQPVSLVGQMKRHERERYRITIPEVIKLIEEQTNGQIPHDARYPVPAAAVISEFIAAFTGKPQPAFTSHPVCGAGTYVYVERKGDEIKYIPITAFVDVDGLLERMMKVAEDFKAGRISKSRFLMKGIYELEKFVDKRKQPKGIDIIKMLYKIIVRHDYSTLGEFHYRFLFLGMMHFQDPYNYDVDRVRRCVIHYGTPDGRVIPFCAFNVFPELYRDYIQKEFSIPLEEREKEHGKTEKYVRSQELIKKLESGEPYIKHYKPFRHLRKK